MKHLITRLRISALQKASRIRATRIALASGTGDDERVQALTPGLSDMQKRIAALKQAIG